MKLWRISIQFIDWISLRSIWNFQVGYFSSEVLKLTHSAHRLDQFAKQLSFSSKLFELWSFFEVDESFKVLKLRFLNKLFQLWRLSIFPSCFLDEIGSRLFFHARYVSLKLRKSNFLKYWIAKKIFKKATHARKTRTIWMHLLDCNVSLNSNFLSKVFDLWIFQVFHFIL